MDLGYFRRSRRRFLAWILCPALVVSTVASAWWVSSRATREALERRNAYMTLLPAMDRKLDVAHQLLEAYAIEVSEGGALVDALTSDIQRAAREQAFTINSLAFKEAARREDAPPVVTGWIAVVKGEGSLTAVVRFLRQLYTDHRLMVVESMSLTSFGRSEDAAYAGEFRVRFLDLDLPDHLEFARHQRSTP